MPDREKLAEFTAWRQSRITGDEKGQAQVFLDRIFQAGQSGSLDVGGTAVSCVRKADEDGGGMAFTSPGVPQNYPDTKKLVTAD